MVLSQTALPDSIIEAAGVLLNAALIGDVEDVKAGLVRPGLLQEDPQEDTINVLIHTGGEEWPDVVSMGDDNRGITSPYPYVLGSIGAGYWRRRFVAEIRIYFVGEPTRESARQKSLLVLARAHHALATWDVGRAVSRDSFGEAAVMPQVNKEWIEEGGGDGDYNWNGEIWFEVLTEYEPT